MAHHSQRTLKLARACRHTRRITTGVRSAAALNRLAREAEAAPCPTCLRAEADTLRGAGSVTLRVDASRATAGRREVE